LREVSKGNAQREIPQLHWERLVGLGYAVWRSSWGWLARSRSPSVAGAAIPTSTSDPPASCCDTRPPCARYLRRRAPPTPTRITAGWPTWNTATTRSSWRPPRLPSAHQL